MGAGNPVYCDTEEISFHVFGASKIMFTDIFFHNVNLQKYLIFHRFFSYASLLSSREEINTKWPFTYHILKPIWRFLYLFDG